MSTILDGLTPPAIPLLPALKARITVSATRESRPFVIRNYSYREMPPTILFFLERGADVRVEATAGVDKRYADELRREARGHREELWERQEGKCGVCGQYAVRKMQIHHKVAIVDGGGSDIENLCLVCIGCHRGIHGQV